MKTTDELIEYRLPKVASGWGRITYEELDAIVKRAQEDAFECGRLAGLNDALQKCSTSLNKREFLAFLCEASPKTT